MKKFLNLVCILYLQHLSIHTNNIWNTYRHTVLVATMLDSTALDGFYVVK